MIRKGTKVLIELADGGDVVPQGALLHDPTGKWWPVRSCLIGSFDKHGSARAAKPPKEAAQYLGRNYEIHAGTVSLPPRELSQWERIGSVETIYYERHGTKARGRFRHRFNRGLSAFIKGKGKVTLYHHGRWYRLELPRGALLDDRGFVWP